MIMSDYSTTTKLSGNIVMLPYVQTIGFTTGMTGESAGGPLVLPSPTFKWCDSVTNATATIFWTRQGALEKNNGLALVTATLVGVC
jgi:hypothetical protein